MNHHETVINLIKTHFGDKEISGIEIGTGGGALPAAIMLLCPHVLKLITIDPWKHKDNVEFEASWPQERLDATREEAFKRLAIYKDRISIMHMTSGEAINSMPKEVDFVHIDGDHSEKGITTDLELYYPLVKKGGILSGHDYGQCHPLTEIIKEKFGDRINMGCDFVWWVFV